MTKLLTMKELTAFLKVHRDTIYRWRNERDFPFKRIGNRAIRYDLAEVEAWIKSQGKDRE